MDKDSQFGEALSQRVQQFLDKKYGLTALSFLLFSALIAMNGFGGKYGVLGPDSDDIMRYMQIHDLLHGQSWFNTDQLRMGLSAAGTDMHWSRLGDVPILALMHIFDIILPASMALDLAIFIWPPLCGILFFAIMIKAASQAPFDGDSRILRNFAIMLLLVFVVINHRFKSGALDHHNLQFLCMAVVLYGLIGGFGSFKRFAIAGIALGFSIAIGPEVYIFAGIICLYVALCWLLSGPLAAKGAQGFGLGLASTVTILFFLTVTPAQYKIVYCDALSLITVIAALCGGLGLFCIARFSASFKAGQSLIGRGIALGFLGIICLLVLSIQGPQCLVNPLNDLPQSVKTLWLGYIIEAKPLYDLSGDWAVSIPVTLGPPLTALALLIWRLSKRRQSGLSQSLLTQSPLTQSPLTQSLWDVDVVFFLLLVIAIAMSIYQIRFSPLAYIFALLPLIRGIAQSYEIGVQRGGTNIKYIGLFAMALPVIWSFPGVFLMPINEIDNLENNAAVLENGVKNPDYNCSSDTVMAFLGSVPAGTILASSNDAGPILRHTDHRVISGNYHRNWQGIAAEITISLTPPDTAHAKLAQHQIDYLYYCETGSAKRLVQHDANGLLGQIDAGEVPDYLQKISPQDLNAGHAMIFKIAPKP